LEHAKHEGKVDQSLKLGDENVHTGFTKFINDAFSSCKLIGSWKLAELYSFAEACLRQNSFSVAWLVIKQNQTCKLN
jgi:hypothetical protein